MLFGIAPTFAANAESAAAGAAAWATLKRSLIAALAGDKQKLIKE
jgi:hypothetical protein